MHPPALRAVLAVVGLFVAGCVASPSSAVLPPPTPPTEPESRTEQHATRTDSPEPSAPAPVASCPRVGDAPLVGTSGEAFTIEFTWVEEVGETAVALPKEPERLELEGGAGQMVVADEFGDAFGVIAGSNAAVSFALGRALDQLYGAEWGTAAAPSVDAPSGNASFEAFGEQYQACWRQQGPVLLFSVVRPERQPRAELFVSGTSVR